MAGVTPVTLKEGERVDDLMRGGLRIIQSRSLYSFGLDAVLLAHYVEASERDLVVELGSGNGVIAILLSALTPAVRIIGVEIQPALADMAGRSVEMNGLGDRIRIIEGDLRESPRLIGAGSAGIVVTNPPYVKQDAGASNPGLSQALARHEITCTFQDVTAAAARLLKNRGELFLVHRADRLVDVVSEMRLSGIEPKRIRPVHPLRGSPADLILVRGRKGGGRGLIMEPPLYVREDSGEFSPGMRGIYG